jgi:hypothetical protein
MHTPSLALPSALPPSPALPGMVPSSLVLPCMLPPLSALPSMLSPSFTLPCMLPPSLALPNMLPPSLALPRMLPCSHPCSLLPAWLSTLLSPQSVPHALLPSLAFPGPSPGPPWRCPSLLHPPCTLPPLWFPPSPAPSLPGSPLSPAPLLHAPHPSLLATPHLSNQGIGGLARPFHPGSSPPPPHLSCAPATGASVLPLCSPDYPLPLPPVSPMHAVHVRKGACTPPLPHSLPSSPDPSLALPGALPPQ